MTFRFVTRDSFRLEGKPELDPPDTRPQCSEGLIELATKTMTLPPKAPLAPLPKPNSNPRLLPNPNSNPNLNPNPTPNPKSDFSLISIFCLDPILILCFEPSVKLILTF